MRVIAVVLAASLFFPVTAAQLVDLEQEPGAVTPDSPLYALDVWLDDLLLDVNQTTVGAVAEERAAEAWAMYEAENPNATERAVDELKTLLDERDVPDAEREGVGRAIAMAIEVKTRMAIDTGIDQLAERFGQ